VFEYTEEGYEEAKAFLEEIGECSEQILEQDGYSLVYIANERNSTNNTGV
jgi:hypothetical protein